MRHTYSQLTAVIPIFWKMGRDILPSYSDTVRTFVAQILPRSSEKHIKPTENTEQQTTDVWLPTDFKFFASSVCITVTIPAV